MVGSQFGGWCDLSCPTLTIYSQLRADFISSARTVLCVGSILIEYLKCETYCQNWNKIKYCILVSIIIPLNSNIYDTGTNCIPFSSTTCVVPLPGLGDGAVRLGIAANIAAVPSSIYKVQSWGTTLLVTVDVCLLFVLTVFTSGTSALLTDK